MPKQTKGHVHLIVGKYQNYTAEIYNRGPEEEPIVHFLATADELATYLVGYLHSRSEPLTISVEVPER